MKKQKLNLNVYSFYFAPHVPFYFTAGQYVQLTLPHDADERGTTRFFSISSAPQEKQLILTIKNGRSSFKKMLSQLQEGDTVQAFGPMGNFILED